MVEVFKTNIRDKQNAEKLIVQIGAYFPAYKANFDLDDCDNILRIACTDKTIEASSIIKIVKGFGFKAEVL
jgi:hypothetical protein